MSGKSGRSGRPPGSTRETPISCCGRQLQAFMELFLAMQRQRRWTVPDKIMRAAARDIIDRFRERHPNESAPAVESIMTWARRYLPPGTLRRRAMAPARSSSNHGSDAGAICRRALSRP